MIKKKRGRRDTLPAQYKKKIVEAVQKKKSFFFFLINEKQKQNVGASVRNAFVLFLEGFYLVDDLMDWSSCWNLLNADWPGWPDRVKFD